MRSAIVWLFLLASLWWIRAPAAAAPTTFSSGPAPVALIELFTSEGCSSCPPAEQWLARLRDEPGLWTEFVPVAWHVTYWDYLGWRDVFASKDYTNRQHAYADAWQARSVYTPCFVRNGREWRARDVRSIAVRDTSDAGMLHVTHEESGTVRVRFDPPPSAAKAAAGYEAHVVLLGGGVTSRVHAGENAGRALSHEFVALAWRRVPLAPDAHAKGNGSDLSANISIAPGEKTPPAPRRAIAVWVTRRGELAPVQAAGAWLKE